MSGLTLLNSVGLLALGAFAVPIVIHLFSRSRGRRIWVGNIALYRQPKRQRVFEPRIQQWLLLILRLLLLFIAAMWLADLAAVQQPRLPGESVYVTPRWLASASDETVASLGGDQRFVIAPAFPSLDSVAGNPALSAESGVATADMISLLTTRLEQIDHLGVVKVYATSSLAEFPAYLVGIGADVQWHLSAPLTPRLDAPRPRLEITILHAVDRLADAQQLASRLELAGERLAWDVNTSLGDAASDVAGPDDDVRRVIVALGVDPVSSRGDASLLLEDSAGSSGSSSYLQFNRVPGERFRVAPVARSDDTGHVVWRAMDGRPVLTGIQHAGHVRLRYLDRLAMTDGGPMGSEAFAEVLLRLFFGESIWTEGFASAVVDPAEVLHSGGSKPTPVPRSLADWLSILLALLVLAERVLSERRVSMGRA